MKLKYIRLTMQMIIGWQKKLEIYQMTDRWIRLTINMKRSFAVSVKYKIDGKTYWKKSNDTNHKDWTTKDELKKVHLVLCTNNRVGYIWTVWIDLKYWLKCDGSWLFSWECINLPANILNKLLIVRMLFCVYISSKLALLGVFRNFTALFCRSTRGWITVFEALPQFKTA